MIKTWVEKCHALSLWRISQSTVMAITFHERCLNSFTLRLNRIHLNGLCNGPATSASGNPFLNVPNVSGATEFKKGYVMLICYYDTNGKKKLKRYKTYSYFLRSQLVFTEVEPSLVESSIGEVDEGVGSGMLNPEAGMIPPPMPDRPAIKGIVTELPFTIIIC
ncbi:hypothetical protein KQX54_001501 [Cotesia glomerata]|uniref:Uncharacterized protein n=1 Tax=Cotesia glomerata TaxID=32391 RepID=A0AAV7IE51_COTGL|nr:hypothetical protein KQX54_001501 [Cotesia glomerata]